MIDWKRVAELRDEVGAEDFAEVVDLFLEEVDAVIELLRTSPDPAGFEAELHLLKGSALNLGFSAFATLCSEGERTAADGQADTVDIGQIIKIYEISVAEFVARVNTARTAA